MFFDILRIWICSFRLQFDISFGVSFSSALYGAGVVQRGVRRKVKLIRKNKGGYS